MAGAVLSADDRALLLKLMRRQLNSTVHRRINVLLLLDDGWAAERIAEALYIDAETVREHRRLYESSGVSGLQRLAYVGAAPDLTSGQRDKLTAELESRLYMTSKEVCAFVSAEFAVDYTPNAMSKLLNRLGFVYKKPKRVPAKADAAVQRQFAEQTLAPLMAEAGPEKPLYFADAAHPAYTGHPACGWIKKGGTRELKSNHGRVNVTINGALSWPDREVVRREAGKITSAAMIELFEELASRHPTATAIHVVLDNARYNHSKEIKAYLQQEGCRIKLVYLPTYAPNLNLIERLWLLLKKKALWNRYFPCFADFKAAIDGFFDNISDYRAEIASLITGSFHYIGASNPQAP
jgi:transposase